MPGVSSISPGHLYALQQPGENIELIDVRTAAEYRAGHADGARHLPLDQLTPEVLEARLKHPDAGQSQPLYLTCHSGLRAQQAAERLSAQGYHNLTLVDGGTQAWETAGLPMHRCGSAMGEMTRAECVSMHFKEGDRLRVDNLQLEVLYTPIPAATTPRHRR